MTADLLKTSQRRRAAGRQRRVGCRVAAFTLIEILASISIISLLLAILLPALASAREKGRLVKCLANMRSTSQALGNFQSSFGRLQLVSDEIGRESADPDRNLFSYAADGELLAWPAALAKMDGTLTASWEWGVRAGNFSEAKGKEGLIDTKSILKWLVCPSDMVRVASAYYPRNKGSGNNGMVGSGDPADPHVSEGDSYWGRLSYALNEDITGAETSESRGVPACWRRIYGDGQAFGCRGEFVYPPASPCGGQNEGKRLQGNLDRVYASSDVGLVFEAGRDPEDANSGDAGFANLVTSALAAGPYLEDFQQFHQARLPKARHPSGSVNVLYADFHGGSISPTAFNPTNGLPSLYSPRVRISPYRP